MHTPEATRSPVRGILKKKSPGSASTSASSSPNKGVTWDAENFANIAREKALEPYGTMKIDEPHTPFARGSPSDGSSSGDESSPHVAPLSPPNPLDSSAPIPPAPSEWDSPLSASHSPRRRRSAGFAVPPPGGPPVPEDGTTPPRPGETAADAAARHQRFLEARRRHYNEFKVAVQYQALAHERARLRQRDELSGALAHPHKTVSPHRADSPATAAATADASVADMDETAMAGVGRSDGAIAESLFAVSAPMQCEDDGAAATARSPARSRTVPAHALSVLDTPPRERDVAVLAALHTPPLALPPGHAAAVVAPVDVVDETLPTPPPPPSGARAPPAASSQSR